MGLEFELDFKCIYLTIFWLKKCEKLNYIILSKLFISFCIQMLLLKHFSIKESLKHYFFSEEWMRMDSFFQAFSNKIHGEKNRTFFWCVEEKWLLGFNFLSCPSVTKMQLVFLVLLTAFSLLKTIYWILFTFSEVRPVVTHNSWLMKFFDSKQNWKIEIKK